jgi:hypothetical protein
VGQEIPPGAPSCMYCERSFYCKLSSDFDALFHITKLSIFFSKKNLKIQRYA